MKYRRFREEAVLHLVDKLKEANPFVLDLKMQMWLMARFGSALEIAEFYSYLYRLLEDEKKKFTFRRIGEGDPASLADFINDEAIAQFTTFSRGDIELTYAGADLASEKGFFDWDVS